MTSLADRIQTANRHLREGQPAAAEAIYRSLIGEQPDNPTFHYMMGVIARIQQRLGEAIGHLERADRLRPDDPGILSLLADSRRAQGEDGIAETLFRRVLERKPDHADAAKGMGLILFKAGDFAAAADHLARAAKAGEGSIDTGWHLGVALARSGRAEQAIAVLEALVKKAPDQNNVVIALAEVLSSAGRNEQAIEILEQAVRRQPDSATLRTNLAKVLRLDTRLAEAARELEKVVEMRPEDADPRGRLGLVYQNQGRVAEAIAQYRIGRDLDPTGLAATNFLMAMHYEPAFTPDEIARAHAEWGRRAFSVYGGDEPVFENSPEPNRRLKIGYVSSDLRRHSVGYFMAPIFDHHDRKSFDVHAFADLMSGDEMSESLARACDHWHEITGMSDQRVADRVQDLNIDILVDLNGHTGGNRLRAFARRAAPIQVTYLGYPDTTGLPTMDYRLSDAVADPPGEADRRTAETLVRLPRTFLCYRPAPDPPDPGPPPSAEGKPVTFGSFNNIAKISDPVLTAWARVLSAAPDSRLMLKATVLGDEQTRRHLARRLEAANIPTDRVTVHLPLGDHRDHLAVYNQIDVALDTFPYNGTTTTCEALWMGVPVVTLAGDSHVSRVGASLLQAVGLPDMVAANIDEYVAHAVALAWDGEQRAALRRDLRAMMGRTLLDGPNFVDGLETAYRAMWQTWCTRAEARP